MTTLPILPEEHAERARLRGCRNCTAYDGQRCRNSSPGPHGFPEMPPDGWCLSWAWVIQPRVGWGSAIAPAERANHIPAPHNDAVSGEAELSQSHTEEPPF